MNHKNIVHLEGFIMERGFPTLVSLWAEKGSLRNLIKLQQEYDTVQMVRLDLSTDLINTHHELRLKVLPKASHICIP